MCSKYVKHGVVGGVRRDSELMWETSNNILIKIKAKNYSLGKNK